MTKEQEKYLLTIYKNMKQYCASLREDCLRCTLYNHDYERGTEPCLVKLYTDVVEYNVRKDEDK